MGHGGAAPVLDRQARLGAVERLCSCQGQALDLALLVEAEHDGMGRRIDIEPDYLLELVGELGIVGELEGAHPMRLQPVPDPDAAHRGRTDPHRLGHGRRRPMGRFVRRGLVGQGNNAIDGLGRQWRDARRPRLVRVSPATPSCIKRSCQRQTTVLPLPTARMTEVVPAPSAVRAMIRARQTCFCGLLRSRMIDCKRARSAGVTSMVIPLRMPHNRTPSAAGEP